MPVQIAKKIFKCVTDSAQERTSERTGGQSFDNLRRQVVKVIIFFRSAFPSARRSSRSTVECLGRRDMNVKGYPQQRMF